MSTRVITEIKQKKATPFLRWTGSKNWLVREGLSKYLPEEFNNYHECFLGGGAAFFDIEPTNKVFLYDINEDLIETYQQVKNNLEMVIKSLKKLKNTEEDYYRIRKSKCVTPHTRAARFIYLNKCSFNGIYRVNSKGEYNVPYGKRKNVDLIVEENLEGVSKILQNTHLVATDFGAVLDNISENDLVFLDPPYTVTHENNGFIEYNKKLFSWDDQERLAEMIKEIDKRGAYFILTNAEHLSIRKLYKGLGNLIPVSRYSKVGGRNKTRGIFNEIIITNVK